MSDWTPGPWTMETVRTSVGLCFRVGPFPWRNGKLNHACIYADYPNSAEHATGEANARLIAAAPELYEALNETAVLLAGMLEPCDHAANICWCGVRSGIEQARAALAKAKGDSA